MIVRKLQVLCNAPMNSKCTDISVTVLSAEMASCIWIMEKRYSSGDRAILNAISSR